MVLLACDYYSSLFLPSCTCIQTHAHIPPINPWPYRSVLYISTHTIIMVLLAYDYYLSLFFPSCTCIHTHIPPPINPWPYLYISTHTTIVACDYYSSLFIRDESMKKANIICFTETFLRPQQDSENSYIPSQDDCQVFRMDRLRMSSEDLARGGVMIVCPILPQPVRINIECPPQLEIVSIMATSTQSGL